MYYLSDTAMMRMTDMQLPWLNACKKRSSRVALMTRPRKAICVRV